MVCDSVMVCVCVCVCEVPVLWTCPRLGALLRHPSWPTWVSSCWLIWAARWISMQVGARGKSNVALMNAFYGPLREVRVVVRAVIALNHRELAGCGCCVLVCCGIGLFPVGWQGLFVWRTKGNERKRAKRQCYSGPLRAE
jgi:hypothetical protein